MSVFSLIVSIACIVFSVFSICGFLYYQIVHKFCRNLTTDGVYLYRDQKVYCLYTEKESTPSSEPCLALFQINPKTRRVISIIRNEFIIQNARTLLEESRHSQDNSLDRYEYYTKIFKTFPEPKDFSQIEQGNLTTPKKRS